jgi:hypothetical protein
VFAVKQRDIKKWQHKFKGSDAEWEVILSHFLLQTQPEGEDAAILDGVRMVSTIKNDQIQITIRQDVQGIKVNMPAICDSLLC